MKLLSLFLLAAAIALNGSQDKWATANSAISRLPPATFSQLPKNVITYLHRKGCTIPQTYLTSKPHNVISGEFARRGQIDWAVLCSKNGRSSILVFWNGSTKSVSEIGKAPDSIFVQVSSSDGKTTFSRVIDPVGRDYILRHYREYGGPKPPEITHQGIDDGYLEKGSVVLYYHRGKWLQLHGAD